MKLIAIGEIEHTDLDTDKLKVAKPGEVFNVDGDTAKKLLAIVPAVARKPTKADTAAPVAGADEDAEDGDHEDDEGDGDGGDADEGDGAGDDDAAAKKSAAKKAPAKKAPAKKAAAKKDDIV